MMFDHGCDMLNCFIATSTLCKILQVGNSWYFIVVLFMTMTAFYLATLEE